MERASLSEKMNKKGRDKMFNEKGSVKTGEKIERHKR